MGIIISLLSLLVVLLVVGTVIGDSNFMLDTSVDVTGYTLLSSDRCISRIRCAVTCERLGCGYSVWDEEAEMCYLYSSTPGTGDAHTGDVYRTGPCVTFTQVKIFYIQ